MKRRTSQPALFDTLEARQMMSAATRVIGYVPDYSYEDAVDKIDWNGVTHVNYFSITPNADGTLPWNPQTGEGTSSDHRSLTQLEDVVSRAHSNNVTVSIVIGGADLDYTMDDIFRSQENTATFVQSMQQFVNHFDLDSIDLDWEPKWDFPPPTSDIDDYGHMIAALDNAMPNVELSAAVSVLQMPVDTGWDDPNDNINGNVIDHRYVLTNEAINHLDHIGLMAYDLEFDDHSPTGASIDHLENWRNNVVGDANKEKLVLGLPFYGSAGSSWGTRKLKSYADLYDRYIHQYGTAPAAGVDHFNLSFSDVFGGQPMNWYFNSRETLATKTDYVVDHDYGGVMIWDLAQDHFAGGGYDTTSLLPAVKDAAGLDTSFGSFDANTGRLTLDGTSGTDSFVMTNYRNRLIVWRNDVGEQFDFLAVTGITINANGGADTVHAYGMNIPISFNAGTTPSSSGNLRVSDGNFSFNTDMGGSTGNVSLVVDPDATVILNSSQHLASLTVNGTAKMTANGGRVLVTDGLSIGANGTLDLNDNDLILDYSGSSPRAAVQTLINTARAGGAWTGKGITSTSAKNSAQHNTTLGMIEASEYKSILGNPNASFAGEPIDATAVLIKYTYYGDANFSGAVTFDDYVRIDTGFNAHRTGWSNGDFNGDGTVNFDDYVLIDSAFNTHGTPLSRSSGKASAAAGSIARR